MSKKIIKFCKIPFGIKIPFKKAIFYPGNDIKVSYAYMVPRAHEIPGGGRIKLICLDKFFPEQKNEFNILYLISSALPDYLAAWIKICKKAGIKITLNQNGVAYRGCYGHLWEKINRPLKIALDSADYVIYQSKFCKMSANKFLGAAKVPNDILYNPVDIVHFAPLVTQSNNSKELTILLGGNQYEYYRFETAIRTAGILKARLGQIKLIVSGKLNWLADQRAAEKKAFQLLKKFNLEESVEFSGPYSQEKAPDIYRKADIFLHTKYNDPCPTAVIEAMACGLPVVYSDSGGVSELVGADAGIGIAVELNWEKIIPPDPVYLAEAILRVAGSLSKFSQAARERAVTCFDTKAWINKHKIIFQNVIHNR